MVAPCNAMELTRSLRLSTGFIISGISYRELGPYFSSAGECLVTLIVLPPVRLGRPGLAQTKEPPGGLSFCFDRHSGDDEIWEKKVGPPASVSHLSH